MKKCKPTYTAVVAALTLGAIYSGQAMAEDWTDQVTIGGFTSAVYQVTDQAEHFNGEEGITEDGSFQGTRMGLNINARLSDKVTMASQFLAIQGEDNYVTHLDWGFISYALSEEWTLRAGKIKYPAGIVNEYVAVGTLYPWIAPPTLLYTAEDSGPQATREAYTGFSGLWEHSIDDWTVGSDLFFGEVDLGSMIVRKLSGLTLRADWNEVFQAQATTFSGTMDNPAMAAMDGEKHAATLFGVKMDWNNVIGLAEWADVDMGSFTAGAGQTWYTTLGYRIDRWMPHVTYQDYEKGLTSMSPQEQHMTTYGLKYDLSRNTSLKVEYSTIETEQGTGLFTGSVDKSANMYGVAIDVTF